MNIKDTITTLLRDGLILVFNQDKLDIVKTAQALIKAGVNNMEVTCRISKPLEKLSLVRKELPDFAAGAASLIDNPDMLEIYNKMHSDDPLPSVDDVVQAGASYLVSAANFRKETYEKYAGKLTMIPGNGTVTEIVQQYSMGANFCKVFPAKELGGPAYVKAIDPAIHKIISLIPTGGTNLSNMSEYINAGVLALGGSFSMIEKTTMKKIIDEQDYDLLAREFNAIKSMIDKLRAEKYPQLDFAKAAIEDISKVTGRDFNM
jgi:2-dehydro-3-deoxyphosphogluconate aldolase/(4S)-4-hydroxy-2-oxoglutarate aldolase